MQVLYGSFLLNSLLKHYLDSMDIKLRLNPDKTEERFILPMKDQVHNLGGLLNLVLSLNLQMAMAFDNYT